MKNFPTYKLARAAVIAALYASITILLAPITYGPIQFRVSECLCVLAFFYVEAIPGLTIGCLIANIFGNGVLDIIFGTLATLVSSVLAYVTAKHIKNVWLKYIFCSLYNIVINAVVVPFIILAGTNSLSGYFIIALQVGLGQLGVACTFGLALYLVVTKQVKKGNSTVFKIN